MAKKITDPSLISKLDSARKVTDPELINKLKGATSNTEAKKKWGYPKRFWRSCVAAFRAFRESWAATR